MDIRLVSEGDKVYANIYLDDKLSGISKITSSDGQTQTLPQEVNNKRILYIYLNDDYKWPFSKYKNMTYSTDYISVNDAKEYDAVILDFPYWGVPSSLANEYFMAGIPLITIGNDTNSDLYIIKDCIGGTLIMDVNPVVNSIITRKLNLINASFPDSQCLIQFEEEVETWYRGNDGEGDLFDVAGIYEENNTQWFHSQYPNESMLEPLLDYIFKENGARFELTKGKQYTIYGYDVAGNIVERTIYAE